MSGYGERFKKAGYKLPKPLIIIDGKPVIAHIIDLYPGEKNFFFICNKEHLKNKRWNLKNIIKKYAPSAKIISIEGHKKGPVHAIMLSKKFLNPKLPTIVNYCDFTCIWNWKLLKNKILNTKYDGIIPCYRGFHPHSAGKTNYAYIKNRKLLLQDIQEKKPFTSNKVNEFTSSGTYYFSSGDLMMKSFEFVIKNNLNINNEFYVSLAYKFLLKKNKKTLIYPIKHFMQWGTPQDLEEYQYNSQVFKNLLLKKKYKKKYGTNIIPMAGLGKRFKKDGYKTIKPLIPVCKYPMCISASLSIPSANKYLYVLNSYIEKKYNVKSIVKKKIINSNFKLINRRTDGQASTVKIALDFIKKKQLNYPSPYTISVCDSAVIYNQKKFDKLIKNKNIDVIIWTKSNYPYAFQNPHMYGWLRYDKNKKIKISVKKPFNKINKKIDHVIIGTFTFKKISDVSDAINNLMANKEKINGEYYMDSCIKYLVSKGLKCAILDVESYICWGTPNELKTFIYWRNTFQKWKFHSCYKKNLLI